MISAARQDAQYRIRGAVTNLALDIQDNHLTISRDGIVLLRGRLDTSAGAPLITQESNGWRIAHSADTQVEDVFDLHPSGHWFGGQELVNQLWPQERAMLNAAPLVTSDNGPTGLSCIQTSLWVTSSGIAILADDDQEIHVGFNRSNAQQPLSAWNLDAPPPFERRPAPDDGTGDGLLRLGGRGLRYHLLAADHALQAWRASLLHIGHPTTIQPETLWRLPIWTTWAHFKTDIHQTRVIGFADEIVAHGYPHGVMEIDDRWQVHYGDLAFDPVRFPDPRAMVDALHRRGFRVTCWVMPFINPDANCFDMALSCGYLLQRANGSLLSVHWWQGDGYLLDVANGEALEWFGDNLRALQAATRRDGWKFDAGEAIFLGSHEGCPYPNDYTRRSVDFVATTFPFCEVRSGWGNQRAPILFRQWDKSCTWGTDNGLKSVITGALTMGLAGYPFVLPDMVGGNAYRGEQADAELMIRWAQASALFPAIQFSLVPWDYGDECDRLGRATLDLRERYMNRIAAAMLQATRTGEPPIRPVWWLAPDDERAQTCDDEFLLGDNVLVAPVIQPGQRARDVYLPCGKWRNARTGQISIGPTNLPNVSAPLDTLLVYNRV
jgi:alpha-glucosidase (family GH31 glycosyl hydrolase)